MNNRMVWGHLLFVAATAWLIAQLYQVHSAWPASIHRPLTAFGIWLLIGSGVYARHPWQKHVFGGVGLLIAIAADIFVGKN